uniref:Uncharacterized protein n=1 Tax=Anopheles maculatus TaxID=74869 RepID=A0A182T4D0_9DIPT
MVLTKQQQHTYLGGGSGLRCRRSVAGLLSTCAMGGMADGGCTLAADVAEPPANVPVEPYNPPEPAADPINELNHPVCLVVVVVVCLTIVSSIVRTENGVPKWGTCMNERSSSNSSDRYGD